MVFDTHAHYDSGAFHGERMSLLADMPNQGVALILNPGCDIPSSETAVSLARQFPHVYAAVGVHPGDCANLSDTWLSQLETLVKSEGKVRAIGEIGLDYHWKDNPPPAHQKSVFRQQMQLAQKLCLPVIIHDREAHADCLEIVKEFKDLRGVYHCYSGGVEDAKTLIAMGWMLSFTGVITYTNARRAIEVIEQIPIEHIMIETDAPYLTPVPHRGKRNHSGYVHLVAEKIAQIKGMEKQDVEKITMENGIRFFGIEVESHDHHLSL